jgi:hypothetical protein
MKSYFLNGNGFFITDHYIVCPAHLVLIPPTVLTVNNRYPFVSVNQPAPNGLAPDTVTSVSRILVDVQRVNCGKKAFTYEAQLVGVDGAGNIALLSIDFNRQWNLACPPIKKHHPYFCFGKSRCSYPGTECFTIGDFTSSLDSGLAGCNSVVAGVISNNRALDTTGYALPELVFASFPNHAEKTGAPIINKYGQVIALQTINIVGANQTVPSQRRGFGQVSGVSQFFMETVINELRKGCHKRKATEHLEIVNDLNGNYLKYLKGYLGIYARPLNGNDFGTTISGSGIENIIVSTSGQLGSGPKCKELIGLKVLTEAGNTSVTYVTIPSASNNPPLVDSPLLNILQPNDIIIELNKCPLGQYKNQIPATLITWNLHDGQCVNLKYRKVSDNYNSIFHAEVNVVAFPALLDYPWVSVSLFPPVSNVGGWPYNLPNNARSAF